MFLTKKALPCLADISPRGFAAISWQYTKLAVEETTTIVLI